LIEHGIKASLIPHDASNLPAEQLVDIITAQQEALEGVFSFVKQDRKLSTSFVKELHSVLTREQHVVKAKNPSGQWIEVPLPRGDWKVHPNNPTRPNGELHLFCPPEHVAAEMDRLIEMHRSHTLVPPEVESAWLHHRFTQIHPFQDGNGRVARAIASMVSIKAGWFPLLIRRQDVAEYIHSLETADNGSLDRIVQLFSRRHAETFRKANALAVLQLGHMKP
jgi:Fic family protein